MLNNIYSFSQLWPVLDKSYKVKVVTVKHSDFKGWTKHHNTYYDTLKNIIKPNHIFSCKDCDVTTDATGKKSVVMMVREAEVPDAKSYSRQIKKSGRKNNELPNSTQPEEIPKGKRNAYKIIQYHKDWAKVIPMEHHAEMCIKPSVEQLEKVKGEAAKRAELKRFRKGEKPLTKKEPKRKKARKIQAKKPESSNEDNSDDNSEDNVNLKTLELLKNMQSRGGEIDCDGGRLTDTDHSDSDEDVPLFMLDKRLYPTK